MATCLKASILTIWIIHDNVKADLIRDHETRNGGAKSKGLCYIEDTIHVAIRSQRNDLGHCWGCCVWAEVEICMRWQRVSVQCAYMYSMDWRWRNFKWGLIAGTISYERDGGGKIYYWVGIGQFTYFHEPKQNLLMTVPLIQFNWYRSGYCVPKLSVTVTVTLFSMIWGPMFMVLVNKAWYTLTSPTEKYLCSVNSFGKVD